MNVIDLHWRQLLSTDEGQIPHRWLVASSLAVSFGYVQVSIRSKNFFHIFTLRGMTLSSLPDQRWSMAPDSLHLPDPGPKPAPHSGSVQPTHHRTRGTLSPGGWTRVLLITPCGRAWEYSGKRSDCMEMDWGEGTVMDRIDNPTPPHPPYVSTKYAWTAETGGGSRERRPVENAERWLLALISLWKTMISFFFRDLFVWHKTWRPLLTGSNMNISLCHLSDHVVSYSLHGLKHSFAKKQNKKKGFFKRDLYRKLTSVTSTNAIIPILMSKYYLYMYMYCIL